LNKNKVIKTPHPTGSFSPLLLQTQRGKLFLLGQAFSFSAQPLILLLFKNNKNTSSDRLLLPSAFTNAKREALSAWPGF
jgi:hypothetical protein